MSEAKANGTGSRPLSPHVQVWRWHLTALASIMHRGTGVALYVGALIAAGWATSLAAGPQAFEAYRGLLGSPLGLLVMVGLTFSAFYHLANGVRHLFWDAGTGFEPRTATATAAGAIAFAIVATAAVWVIACLTGAA
jgi:succinate dehydrogenase / fumarate reductase, cytochrome b subunit